MNSIMTAYYPIVEEYQAMRTQLMLTLSDSDLAFTPGGANPPLGALCKENGEVEQAYIASFKTFTLDFSYRNNTPGLEGSVAQLAEWFDALDAELKTTVAGLSQADIDGLINKFKESADSLSNIINNINSNNGSLGALLNDKSLYNNLNNVTRSLNILIDYLRAHPKRYVSISIFGGKDKGTYLTEPLNDSATNKR
mgnify:CR=1 FL=1